MKKDEILNAITSLSKNQGFYKRLLEEINNDESILNNLEQENFKDTIDLILFLEY